MFENRTKKERTIIYALIAVLVTTILAFIHYYFQGYVLLLVLIMAVIEYFIIFYILYLPLKYQRK